MHRYANILFHTDRDGRHHARIHLPMSPPTEFIQLEPTYRLEKLMMQIHDVLTEKDKHDDPE